MTEQAPPQRKFLRRLFRVVMIILAVWFLLGILLMVVIHFYGLNDNAAPADVIIVLGAGVQRDGSPGPALIRRTGRAVELWRQGIAENILCTGAIPESRSRSEAAACRDALLARGVADSAIFLEENSRSTEENAIESKLIMQEEGWQRAVVVTDGFHTLRANWIFANRGVDARFSPVPADRMQGMVYFYSLLRETLALHWQAVKEALNLPFTHVYLF